MNRRRLSAAILGLLFAFTLSAAAQDGGYWRASSSTAQSITGDIALAPEKLSINLTSFTIANIRALSPSEASAVFNEGASGGTGILYRLNIPFTKKFLHKNTLCGTDDTQWMVAYAAGRTLRIAFFSGNNTPVFTPEAVANSTSLCGTFLYSR